VLSTHPEERAQRILAQLPARYREVLTYRFLLNYSIKDTAAKMNLTEANVKVLQFRALKKAGHIELGEG
jgi:RNA polymerase sigma-70 factor (ECF subfamily)